MTGAAPGPFEPHWDYSCRVVWIAVVWMNFTDWRRMRRGAV